MARNSEFVTTILSDLAKSDSDALSLFRVMQTQLPAVVTPASQRLIRGGNRSGKSILGAAMVAAVARSKPLIGPNNKKLPLLRPPGIPQLIWVIGKGESHIGSTLYRLLFTPGQFPLFRQQNGIVRAARNWEERAAGLKQGLVAPPFIPEDEIEMIAFNKKAADYFDVVKLKNGSRIESYVSSGDVKMGDPVDWIWIDEDIAYPAYVNEWLARLPDKKGCFCWTAWPWSDNWALTGMSHRAKEQTEREKPDLIEIKLSFKENPFIDEDEKRKAMEAWGASGSDELKSRCDGEFAIGEKLMYPTFGPGTHGCPQPDREIDLLTKTLQENQWEPPKTWTRYLFYDPGHTTTAILFCATPPPDRYGDVVVAYDELYLHCLDAHQVAERLRPKLTGVVFEDFVIDQRFSRQTIAALGRTQYEIFAEVWSALGFRSVRSGGAFTFASDNKDAGCEAVRVWLTVRGDGTTKFRFIQHRCQNLLMEMQAYCKKIVKDQAQEKPGTNQRDHLVDCFDDQTEVLSRDGWRRFSDLNGTEQLATVNLETDALEYQQPEALIAKDYSGEMFRFGGHKMNAMVTPTHRMVVYPRWDEQPVVKQAQDLGVWDRLKLNCKWGGGDWSSRPFLIPRVANKAPNGTVQLEKEVDAGDFAEFLGWYVAEGSLGKPQCPGRGYQVIVSQCKPSGVALLGSLLGRLPFTWQQNKDGFYTSSKQLWTMLAPLGNAYSKRVPQWIKEASPSIIRRFLVGAVLGDGWKRGNSRAYATVSPLLADDMQELFLKIGTAASVRIRKAAPYNINGRSGTNTVDQYWIYEWMKRFGLLRNKDNRPNFAPETYNGRVYCATVPNGTLVVRRDGKPLIAGNCLRYGSMHGCPYVQPPDAAGFMPPCPVYQSFQSHKVGTDKPKSEFPTFHCGAGSPSLSAVR